MNFQQIWELVKTYVTNVFEQLNIVEIAYALVIAIAGVSITFLARRITRVVEKKNDIKDDDKFMLTLKIFGLLLIFVALLMVIFQAL